MSWREAAEQLKQRAGVKPRIGIVLGSGLGEVADAVEGATAIPYSDLPGFPEPTVEGHAGRAGAGRPARRGAAGCPCLRPPPPPPLRWGGGSSSPVSAPPCARCTPPGR